jgi:hypothetical protein
MFKIVIAIVSTIAIGVGGYIGYHEIIESKTETLVEAQKVPKQEINKETFTKIEENEVKDILKTNIDSIFEVFKRSGETYGWNYANPADFSKTRPELLSYATESFADTTLKELAADFYCECDISFKPKINYDIRFSFQQDKENELKITAIEPATEMDNMGSTWEFLLVKEDDVWKMQQWNRSSLEGQDLKLTKEEAEKLLTNDNETATFLQEYESNNAAGKAYVIDFSTYPKHFNRSFL